MMIARIEAQKADVLARLEGWSAERLAYRPAAAAWCATEVLDHIVKGEIEILAAARNGLRNPHRIGLRDRLGFLFIEWVFQSPRRVQVPKSASQVLPDRHVPLEAVRERWGDARKDLFLFLSQLDPEQLRAGVFRHPVSGWMSVPQILRFFSVHMEHHNFQLARFGAESGGL